MQDSPHAKAEVIGGIMSHALADMIPGSPSADQWSADPTIRASHFRIDTNRFAVQTVVA